MSDREMKNEHGGEEIFKCHHCKLEDGAGLVSGRNVALERTSVDPNLRLAIITFLFLGRWKQPDCKDGRHFMGSEHLNVHHRNERGRLYSKI